MKREGEEGGEELKLPGKERNRVGLNLLDCFQLHASSRSLSLSLFLILFISFFLSSFLLLLSYTPSAYSFPPSPWIPHCGEKTFDGTGGEKPPSQFESILSSELLGLIGHFLLSICD